MPVYEYECECGYQCEEYGSIKEGPKSRMKCPNCKKKKLVPCISGGAMAIVEKTDNEVTLGTLAERNAGRMSSEKKKKILDKYKTEKQKLREQRKKPWWREGQKTSPTALSRMSKEEQKRYIEDPNRD